MTAAAPPAEVLEKTDWCMAEMNKVVLAELKKRQTDPKDDLITTLLNASEDGESLTMDELLGAMLVIIVAGHDTTSNTMTLGTAALARNPAYWDYMYRNPDQIMSATLELMRYIAMSTSQPRVAATDFEWNGQHIRQGDLLFLMFAAGNRDPRVFADPEAMNPRRNNEQSLVFAPGIHHCIGHLLAKMQVAEFFAAMVKNFSGAELRDEQLEFMPQIAFRGLFQMNVRMIGR
jgi:pimeloyl-[acyl-carrier protein] synthase